MRAGGEDRQLSIDERRKELCPLDVAAEPEKVPALVPVHRTVRNSPEGPHGVFGGANKVAGPVHPDVLDPDIPDPEKRKVETPPQLPVEGVAHLPGILACAREAVSDCIGVVRLENQVADERVRVSQHEGVVVQAEREIPAERIPAQRGVHAPPVQLDLGDRPILEGVQLLGEESAAMLRPLQIAADPVETACTPGKHLFTREGSRGPFPHPLGLSLPLAIPV